MPYADKSLTTLGLQVSSESLFLVASTWKGDWAAPTNKIHLKP